MCFVRLDVQCTWRILNTRWIFCVFLKLPGEVPKLITVSESCSFKVQQCQHWHHILLAAWTQICLGPAKLSVFFYIMPSVVFGSSQHDSFRKGWLQQSLTRFRVNVSKDAWLWKGVLKVCRVVERQHTGDVMDEGQEHCKSVYSLGEYYSQNEQI